MSVEPRALENTAPVDAVVGNVAERGTAKIERGIRNRTRILICKTAPGIRLCLEGQVSASAMGVLTIWDFVS
jgi:hypothetical protein